MTYENNIANQYFRNKDYKNAEKCWIESINKNCNEARYNLGSYYYNGYDSEPDYLKAVNIWNDAAHEGSLEAGFNVAMCLFHGKGYKKDNQKSYECLKYLASRNHKKSIDIIKKIEKRKIEKRKIEKRKIEKDAWILFEFSKKAKI